MKFEGFQVTKYRNIIDSGWIDVSQITAFVGQNEVGKSNLFEALYCVNPIIKGAKYNIDEDWPVDLWSEKKMAKDTTVCIAEFSLDQSEIASLYDFAKPKIKSESTDEETEETTTPLASPPLPETIKFRAKKSYGFPTTFIILEVDEANLDIDLASNWIGKNIPKFVYIHDYEMTGTQIEINQLQERLTKAENNPNNLSNEDQTILIILDLANIDMDDFIKKGATPEGRTLRSFDKRQASIYLSKQFAKLWEQKDVSFDIDIDGQTLNIFAQDAGFGMPVRLNRRSTGFRWYVSFAWKFSHATQGQYKNCILLLEEPGNHLHYDGQRDLLKVFEKLSSDNTILYTTHLASMVDLANPERVRLVEVWDHHTTVKKGIVSSQKGPMAVIEMRLGLSGHMAGFLGNRKTLIVEGGEDALILHKLSGLLRTTENPESGLSDRIYLWPADGAPKTPMAAAFVIGQKWDGGVLLDTDSAGHTAKKKISDLYLSKLAADDQKLFRVLMLGECADIQKTDAAIEDLFPDDFYLQCVNSAFGLSITLDDLPKDGSDMITKRIESVMKERYGHKKLDKTRVFNEMLAQFDQWKTAKDLPNGTLLKAQKLFTKINTAFSLQ